MTAPVVTWGQPDPEPRDLDGAAPPHVGCEQGTGHGMFESVHGERVLFYCDDCNEPFATSLEQARRSAKEMA